MDALPSRERARRSLFFSLFSRDIYTYINIEMCFGLFSRGGRSEALSDPNICEGARIGDNSWDITWNVARGSFERRFFVCFFGQWKYRGFDELPYLL